MMKLTHWMTTFINNKKNTEKHYLDFEIDMGIENNVINIYPQEVGQIFEGFGGAFTESAGFIYSLMDKKSKNKLIDMYFSKDKMNYNLGRIHLDSCDFSLNMYEAMSDKKDRAMKSFSIERTQKYIIPFIEDVQNKIGKEIDIMVSPWSPPAFMKTNNSRIKGGKLLPEYRGFWADYICKYIKELKAIGLNIKRLSIQNEQAAIQKWESCLYSAEEEGIFIKDYLYPAMIKNDLVDIEIFIWDHNKERVFERACITLNEDVAPLVTGIAFHWYSGDHFEALDLIKRRFPDKKLILSEACIEYSKYNSNDCLKNAQKYAHDIIGNLNAGMNAFYDWNLVLNTQGGPNHVKNFCDAPYLYDEQNKELFERNTLIYIWHFSHFIQPHAQKLSYSRFSTDIDVVAFKNPDNKIVVIILNTLNENKEIFIRLNGKITKINIKKKSISSLIIE